MNAQNIGLSKAFSEGWEAFKKYPGLAIGGYLIYAAIILATSRVQVISSLFTIFALFPLLGGWIALVLNIFRGTGPEIGDLFKGFRRYWRWMATGWLLALAFMAASIVLAIGLASSGAFKYLPRPGMAPGDSPFLPSYLLHLPDSVVAAMVPFVLVWTIIVLALAVRWAFLWFLVADGMAPVPAFGRSAEMVRGWGWKLLGILIVIGLVRLAGAAFFWVGTLFTVPFTDLMLASIYVSLTEGTPEPAVPAEEPPPAA